MRRILVSNDKLIVCKRLLAIGASLLCLLYMAPSLSNAVESFNAIWRDLDLVEELYNEGRYEEAWKKIREIRKRVGLDEPPNYGLEYPGDIRRAIRQYENKLKDIRGYYDSFPKFTGVIIEAKGNYAGYFVVRSGKKKKKFLYDGGLLIVGKDGVWMNKKVTVYYEDRILYKHLSPAENLSHALKLVIYN